MENTNNINYWKKIKNLKNEPLTFIHTPKCGGAFCSQIFKKLNIKNKGHNLAVKGDGITFTVIRNPVDRFESLINYRLGFNRIRKDWPKSLNYVYNDKSISLNQIVEKMSDDEIRNFKPFRNLIYWSKNIDIFITIDKLSEFLSFFGYDINLNDFKKKNISIKNGGKFNDKTKNRISKLFSDDIIFFNKVIID